MLVLDFSKQKTTFLVSRQWVQKLLAKCLVVMKFPSNAMYSISVALVDNRTIKELNREFRHKDAVTDVLAWEGDRKMPQSKQVRNTVDLGEIIICFPQTQKQAKEFGVSFQQEFKKLLVHGFLHILGYDHIKKKDREIMESLEEKLMRRVVKKHT